MKKSLIVLLAVAFIFGGLMLVSNSMAEGNKGPETMTLQTAAAKKPATFPHWAHQAANPCATCHHYQNDAGGQEPCSDDASIAKIAKCESCHNDTFKNEKLRSFKDVGHALCKECHKNSGKETAPTKCNGCHVK